MKATTDHLPSDPLEVGIRQRLEDALDAQRAGDAELVARVKARVLGAIESKSGLLHRTVRAEGGEWATVAPGIAVKRLWERGGVSSCMVRLAPGTTFPGHQHPIDEECVILEGSLRIGADLLLRPGDFHVGLSGIEHESVGTEDGCLCFLRAASCFFEPAG